MTNKYIRSLTLILTLTMVLVNPVIAGIIVKYDLHGSTTNTLPPLILEKPSDTTVDTSLNTYNTAAKVTVEIPSGYIISLESRRAVYWNTFDDYDPITRGELTPLNTDTCSWTWDSVNGELVGETISPSYYNGGECILLINRTIPIDQTIYVNVNMMWDSTSDVSYFSDLVFMNISTKYFYTIGNNYLGNTFLYDKVYLFLWNGTAWNELASSNRFPGQFQEDTWYDLLGIRNNMNGYLAEIYQDILLVDYYDTQLQVDRVGLGMYSYCNPLIGCFKEIVRYDLLLVTLGGPPYYVNITGLQPGWYVEIYDENNNLLIGPVQSTGTDLSIDFWDYKIVKNGTIVIYDSGYNLVTSNKFSWIIGGDTYHVGPATYGSVFNILGFYNNDTATTFNVALILLDYPSINSLTPGSILEEAMIWIESGGQVSDPIIVRYNSTSNEYEIVNDVTSIITLYPQYPGNIYLYWYGDPGITAEFRLLFVYWIDGVLVTYPVDLTVTS